MTSPTLINSLSNLYQENINHLDTLSSDGIIFFRNANDCISHFKQTSFIKKIISFVTSIGTFFYAPFTYISNQFNSKKIIHYTNINRVPLNTKKLIVCIHGLNSSPFQFYKMITEIEKTKDSDTDIFAPYVLKEGNASLDEMCENIYDSIKPWVEHEQKAEQEQGKELVFIGFSNGARIALALETLIAQKAILRTRNLHNIEQITSILIAGACQGSSMINLANKLKLSFLFSESISREIPTTSERNKQLKEEWEKNTRKHPIIRKHAYIASSHDWVVPDIDSNFNLSLSKKHLSEEFYAMIRGHGHSSILNRVTKPIAKLATS